jgi:hypothetical protein
MTAGRWNTASDKFGGDGVRRCDAARLDVSYHRGKRNGSVVGSLFPYFAASRSSFWGRSHCSLAICSKVSGRSDRGSHANRIGPPDRELRATRQGTRRVTDTSEDMVTSPARSMPGC